MFNISKISNLKFKISNLLLTSVFCLLTSVSYAGVDFTHALQKAQLEVLDLRLVSAREILSREKAEHPRNAYVLYLEHFTDIVEIIATDDEGLYEPLMEAYHARIEKMNELGGDSPDNSILQAEMLFYTGLAQLKFGSQVNGAAKIYGSYRQVRAHLKKYPDSYLNLKMAGMYNITMDFIPKSLRWLTGMLGVSGNQEEGMRQLKYYFEQVRSIPGLAQEAAIIINLAYKLTWQDEEGLVFMEELEDSLTANVLAKYVWAISATYCFDNELALRKLFEIDRGRLQVPFYTLDYVTGRCMLNRMEKGANRPLERYLGDYPGEDFKKDACMRLAYYYFLEGDMIHFEKYRAMAAASGQQLRERDQEAMKESESATLPHAGLLEARLLFDGGYFQQADSVMNAIPLYTLNLLQYKLEYSYRQGRIDQFLGRTDRAREELEKAYHSGKDHPYTFACRAALQLGGMYEDREDFSDALYWYNECLKYYDDDHTVSSVEDKAEKGKKRVMGRL